MKEYTLISSDHELIDYRNHLKKNNIEIVAMDFEGEFNLHVYGEKLCLIQIFDGTEYFVIDPLSISRDELTKTLEDKKIMKIFYDATSDSTLIYKQYGIKMTTVYDLKFFVDILNFDKKGLDSVIFQLLNITISKKKKFQQYNWTRRPIEKDAMQYALSDVEYLFDLKDLLFKLVEKEGKIEELIFTIIKKSVDFDKKSIPGILKSMDFKNLKASEKNLLTKIFYLREEIARELNVPPNLVLAKKQLFMVSKEVIPINNVEFNKRIPFKFKEKFIKQVEILLH
jgi:ribonuclease D